MTMIGEDTQNAEIDPLDDLPNPEVDDESRVVVTAIECSGLAAACADACMEERDPQSFAECARLALACASACATVVAAVGGSGKTVAAKIAALAACAEASRACAEECRMHPMSEECYICAAACDLNETSCNRLFKTLQAGAA